MTNNEAIDILNNLRSANEYEIAAIFGTWYSGIKNDVDTAIGMAILALDKQTPLRVRTTTSTKRCRSCGRQLSGIGNIHPERNYCVKCGQAIDWSKS